MAGLTAENLQTITRPFLEPACAAIRALTAGQEQMAATQRELIKQAHEEREATARTAAQERGVILESSLKAIQEITAKFAESADRQFEAIRQTATDFRNAVQSLSASKDARIESFTDRILDSALPPSRLGVQLASPSSKGGHK